MIWKSANECFYGSCGSGTRDVNSYSDAIKHCLEGQNEVLKYDFIPHIPNEEKSQGKGGQNHVQCLGGPFNHANINQTINGGKV